MNLKVSVTNSLFKFQKNLESRLSDSKIRGWLNRRAYPVLLNMQINRWQTENRGSGEGWTPWEQLNPKYQAWKLKKYAALPGGGKKMLVATGRLVKSMIGQSREHRKLVKEKSLEIYSVVPYAKYVDEARDITEIGSKTLDTLSKDLIKYIVGV